MPLAYLLDENLLGLLWRHVQRHNATSAYSLGVVRVGDAADLPLGSDDPAILDWAEPENRIFISPDEHALPKSRQSHCRGPSMP